MDVQPSSTATKKRATLGSITSPAIDKRPKRAGIKEEDNVAKQIASNFADSILKLVNSSFQVSSSLPLHKFHFESGGNKHIPLSKVHRSISTNPEALCLIESLLIAENEVQIDKALATDFTADAANLPHGDRGGGCGAGFQIYLKGKLVLTAGGGGGGGYSSDHYEVLDRGGGGGAQIFLPGEDISASVGGGHSLVNAKKRTVDSKTDAGHNPKIFLGKLKKLRGILSGANPNDIAVLGGGGGGGGETEMLRLRSQGKKTTGGGYNFGFEIGSEKAVKLAKLGNGRPMRTVKAPQRLNIDSFSCGQSYESSTKIARSGNNLNLPEYLLKEEWAQKMANYKGQTVTRH